MNQERNWRNLAANFSYFLPGLLLYLLFFLVPAFQNLFLSLYRMDSLTEGLFVGLENYKTMLNDKLFHLALFHALYFMLVYVTIPVALGLLVAVILAQARLKGAMLLRCVFFLPYIIPVIAVGITFQWVYMPNIGLLDNVLKFSGLGFLQRVWYGDEATAIHALGGIGIWMTFGYMMLIFLAGLQRTDQALYEASRVDGANAWHQLIHITIPSLKNDITVAMVFNLINGLRVFGLVMATTRGGPGNATLVMDQYAIRVAFSQGDLGYGAALTCVVALITLAVSLLVMWVRKEESQQ
ncbi:MAG: carbohydrate ABC transporter permease [Bacillota bacterium]